MDALLLETDGPSLMFQNKKKLEKFELGVSLAISNWDVLNTAVDNQWGGPDSADKRDWMAGIISEAFDQKDIDAYYIEEMLLGIMQDEFDTNVEDESAAPVAQQIIKIYQSVADGDDKVVDELYQTFVEKQRKRQQSGPQKVKVEGEDSEVDDDDDDEKEEGDNNEESTEPKEKEGPVVDDDGFELVQRKKR